ncbi:hypothetical protein [uncultured Algibacter sp.]|uniref:hypothetical protein n=1 Tax=uncultured Algibacter sp. TaxID=298659 RepID=UPI0026336692|nr:hypothetical protein [uncultured Algibacter sp.]
MKNFKYITMFFIATLLFVGCGEDRTVDTVDTNHRIIVTSEMDYENTIAIAGHIDFGDISRGVVSRTWTLPENSTSIQGEDGNTSSKDVIKGFFYKPGVYNVTLNQTFSDNVYPNDDSTMPINGRELDTTIVVTVLDSIKSVLKIYHLNDDGTTGAELVLADNAENEVTASKTLRLTYTATGEPESAIWTSEGGKPDRIPTKEDENEVDMRFNKLGTWDLDFLATRFRPEDGDTLSFKRLIKVIPSTEPVVLERVSEKDDGKVALEFSREMDESTVNADDFSVRIENDGNIINPLILGATLDPDEGNIILLELDNEKLYYDDEVFVSYTPGNLRTADLVDATAITDAGGGPIDYRSVIDIFATIDFDPSMEDFTADESWNPLGWGSPWDKFNRKVSRDLSRTGDNSLYVEFEPFGGMIVERGDDEGTPITIPYEKGKTYELGYWMYVVEGVANVPGSTKASDIRLYASSFAFELVPTIFSPTTTTGQWVYQSKIFKASFSDSVSLLFRGFNEHNPDTLKFYIDDFSLTELPFRP